MPLSQKSSGAVLARHAALGVSVLALSMVTPWALAQSSTTSKPAATKPAPAKSSAGKTSRRAAAGAAAVGAVGAGAAVAANRSLPAASPEQLQAAQYAHLGDHACEFNQSVKVSNHGTDGYLNVNYKGQSWVMKPVMSSTGALRMEDVGGRTLMLQIANKSMLMDQRAGQRMVDECIHAGHTK